MVDNDEQPAVERMKKRAAIVRAAGERGLLGPKDRAMAGRFSEALVEKAKRVSGITGNTELLTYALIKLALEDDFGERLIKQKYRVSKETLCAG